MGLGDVAEISSVPKITIVAPPVDGGAISTRTFIPVEPHDSIGVLGAVSVATAILIPGTVVRDVPSENPPPSPLAARHRAPERPPAGGGRGGPHRGGPSRSSAAAASSAPPVQTTTTTLNHRDRAVLRAVAAGRCEIPAGSGGALVVDGLCLSDQFAGLRLKAGRSDRRGRRAESG